MNYVVYRDVWRTPHPPCHTFSTKLEAQKWLRTQGAKPAFNVVDCWESGNLGELWWILKVEAV